MEEAIRKIKQQFMTYRNGIIADTYRRAGFDCYRIIFGLNLPQLKLIVRDYTPSLPLALRLWNDNGVRESRLLATYLFPHDSVDFDLACTLIESLQTSEEADMLCFNVFKYLPLPIANKLYLKYTNNENKIQAYCAKALWRLFQENN